MKPKNKNKNKKDFIYKITVWESPNEPPCSYRTNKFEINDGSLVMYDECSYVGIIISKIYAFNISYCYDNNWRI